MMLNAFLTVFLCITFLVFISHDVVHGSFIAGPTAQRSSVLVPVPRHHMARSIHSVQEKTRETTLYLGQVARRDLLIGWVPLVTASVFYRPYVAVAAVERESLDFLLYRIMRVREATQQETRLITTGKFNDVQRANVKLAIKFMVENYRLNDAFIAAATYIPDATTSTKLEAGQIGQRAVQNLYTILEYFDSADVQNLKVGQSLALSGKDMLVLKGLDATRQNIDEFLSYFPRQDLERVISKVEEENELNVKEFDPSLGALINMPITKYK